VFKLLTNLLEYSKKSSLFVAKIIIIRLSGSPFAGKIRTFAPILYSSPLVVKASTSPEGRDLG
jgi:hypothetical protein